MSRLTNHADNVTKITNESLASTRRMLRLMDESQDAGAQTLNTLHHQGAQLNTTEGHLDTMHSSLVRSEKHLKQMEKVHKYGKFHCCAFPRRKQSEIKPPTSGKTANELSGHHENMPATNFSNANGDSLSRTERERRQDSPNEAPEDIDKNVNAIDQHVSILKNQALDMGGTVESHNEQLNRMNKKAERNQDKLGSVSTRTTKLLKTLSSGTGFISSLRTCCPCKIF